MVDQSRMADERREDLKKTTREVREALTEAYVNAWNKFSLNENAKGKIRRHICEELGRTIDLSTCL